MPFDSRKFRKDIGFTNAQNLKKYYKANDIVVINWEKIEQCNQRLKNIFRAFNPVIHERIRMENIEAVDATVDEAYSILKENNIFPRLNNNGRLPEDVYYNWMRGYMVCEFFSKALAIIFGVPQESIRSIGRDQLTEIDTFSKSPTADLEITLGDKVVRLEVQSGFTGVNDIKKHKVNEAKKMYHENQIYSYVVHFDLFNGTVAVIDISDIDDNSIHWERRAQLEDQTVFSIPQEAFKWFLPEEPPAYTDILF